MTSALEGMEALFAAAVASPGESSTKAAASEKPAIAPARVTFNTTHVMVVRFPTKLLLITGNRRTKHIVSADTELSFLYDPVLQQYTWRSVKPTCSAAVGCVVGKTTQVGDTEFVVLGIGPAA